MRKKRDIRDLDYRKNDIVQVRQGRFAGRLGKIENIAPGRGDYLVYSVELINESGEKEFHTLTGNVMSFVSRND